MSKKMVVLADNSYTIRRIVELSFSEIENIEVRSFENGSGIKEKLLQLNPAVVIVDIKLPELNGYEVCRFINETPPLNRCHVFLMKGSFEPVDNDMIKNLKYEDIITKPFDSNALVGAVMKIVSPEPAKAEAGFPGEAPSSFPEDFPEIETEAPESEDISFSDIRGDVEAPAAFSRPAPAGAPVFERDEIQPSEEITQGTQPLKDNLMPQESEEPLKNPFDEEPAFDAISVSAPAEAKAISLDFEKEPSPAAPAGGARTGPKDVSDEFHERFMEFAKDDTSEDLLKSSMDSPMMPDSDDLLSPVQKEETRLEFEKTDMGSPAQTMYAGPGVVNLKGMAAKPTVAKAPAAPESKPAERAAEKARPEGLSPQEELARLAVAPRKDVRPEAKASPAAPALDKLELTGKLEEKLSQTIKELLWEIVPPMAEKIIKEEIDKIKSDLNDSGL